MTNKNRGTDCAVSIFVNKSHMVHVSLLAVQL